MTDYTRRVTIVCPEAMTADANQLALVLGESPADDQTFGTPRYEDASGNLYAVSSARVKEDFENDAATTLLAPAHSPEADLTAAERAQAVLYIYGQHGTEGAAPGRLWALVEPVPGDAKAALELAGVNQIETEVGP
jgi:hypothetical protein